MQQTVLVTGATGTVGAQTVRDLRRRGVPTRAFVRNEAKAQRLGLAETGAEVFVGNFTRPLTVREALEGIERLFLVTPASPLQLKLQRDVVDQAQASGVEQIVLLSSVGAGIEASVPTMRWHAMAEREVAQSGVPFTVLRSNCFMQNLLDFAREIARSDGFTAPMADTARVTLIDANDVAAVAAHVLSTAGHEGAIYELTGREPLTYPMIAQKLARALGRIVMFHEIDYDTAFGRLIDDGLPEWQADAMVKLYKFLNAGSGAAVTTTVHSLVGTLPRTFNQFLQDNLDVFHDAAARVADAPDATRTTT